MHAGFFAALRRSRQPIVLIAIWLVVLQTLVAGVAAAQATARLAPNAFDAGVICHGAGAAAPAESPAPDTDSTWHVCCTFCTAAFPPVLLHDARVAARFELGRACGTPAASGAAVLITPRAVRAGLSQAPPSLA